MNIPFLTNDFSGLFDSFSPDSLWSGSRPGISSFMPDSGDIIDGLPGNQFDILDGMPGFGSLFQPGQHARFGDGFLSGDLSAIDDILSQIFAPVQQLLASVLPSVGGTLNFDQFDIQDNFPPAGGYGVRKQSRDPISSVPAYSAVATESLPPVSSVPGVSQPPSFAPVKHTTAGSDPFDTTPQQRPLTQEESRAMAEKVARQLMIDFPGMTKEQAAGIVGNLYHESAGMNANVNEFGSDPSSPDYGMPNKTQFGYGWAQWSGTRKQDFLNFCQREGLDPRSPAANYGFLKYELKNGEADGTPSSLPRILAANTPEDAAFAFRKYYERAAMPVDSERIKATHEIYGLLV
jgi:hypothetical protein